MRNIIIAACLVAAGATASFAHEIRIGALRVSHPSCEFVAAQPGMLAAVVKITNGGLEDDRLIGASFASARDVRLDNHRIEDMPGIVIPAGAALVLKPSVIPLTFANLSSRPTEGEFISGTLVFEKAGVVAVEFEIGG